MGWGGGKEFREKIVQRSVTGRPGPTTRLTVIWPDRFKTNRLTNARRISLVCTRFRVYIVEFSRYCEKPRELNRFSPVLSEPNILRYRKFLRFYGGGRRVTKLSLL